MLFDAFATEFGRIVENLSDGPDSVEILDLGKLSRCLYYWIIFRLAKIEGWGG